MFLVKLLCYTLSANKRRKKVIKFIHFLSVYISHVMSLIKENKHQRKKEIEEKFRREPGFFSSYSHFLLRSSTPFYMQMSKSQKISFFRTLFLCWYSCQTRISHFHLFYLNVISERETTYTLLIFFTHPPHHHHHQKITTTWRGSIL